MKKYVILVGLVGGLYAQNNSKPVKKIRKDYNKRSVITLAIPDLINKVKLKYETGITDEISLGIQGSYHYNSGVLSHFTGFKVEPLSRYYLAAGFNQAPLGMYLQAKLTYGQFQTDQSFAPKEINPLVPIQNTYNLTTYGAGISAGMQWHRFLGKALVFDINVGAQFLATSIDNVTNFSAYPSIKKEINSSFRSTGPGSYLTGTIAIGIPF